MSHPQNTPLQDAIAAVIEQARIDGAVYGMTPELVFRIWTRRQSLDEAMRVAQAEARKYNLTTDWVVRIWNAGRDVGAVMAEASKQRPQ